MWNASISCDLLIYGAYVLIDEHKHKWSSLKGSRFSIHSIPCDSLYDAVLESLVNYFLYRYDILRYKICNSFLDLLTWYEAYNMIFIIDKLGIDT